MHRILIKAIVTISFALPLVLFTGLQGESHAGQKNPCGKNPCAVNNPCGIKNPCAANPCSMKVEPIRKTGVRDSDKLQEKGEKLWNDKKLGKSGMACATCHQDGKGLKKTSFPKYIKMADDILTLDQMITFCLINPMKGKPLQWNSVDLTALAAYAQAHAMEEGEAMHPCGMSHPCGMKHPCGMMHPCSMKNACELKNPCGTKR